VKKPTRRTREELRVMKSRTDDLRVARTTEKEILEQVLRDPDLSLPTPRELKEFRPAPGTRKGPRRIP
jgi:hypothetical protein